MKKKPTVVKKKKAIRTTYDKPVLKLDKEPITDSM